MEPNQITPNPAQAPTSMPSQPTPVSSPTPVSTPVMNMKPATNPSSIGSIVGTIIIIAFIILGGLYFWGKHVEESKSAESLTSETMETSGNMSEDNEAAAIKSTSSSDDLDSIEADLQATNLEDLGAEANPQLQ